MRAWNKRMNDGTRTSRHANVMKWNVKSKNEINTRKTHKGSML